VKYVSSDAVSAMCRYPWPGNIRELAHVIETAVLMTDLDRVTVSDLPAQILTVSNDPDEPMPAPAPFGDPAVAKLLNPSSQPLSAPDWGLPDKSPLLLDDVIKKTLQRSLQQSGGNRRRAADLLGVSRSTLYRMLARYELEERASNPPMETGFAN
jgi:transcriptional regulator of acetoin/glycerol metabolism